MISPLLSAEARKFCETTSVCGIPRIMKSRSTGLFVIWLLGVLTCAGILIWQLVVVFKRYTSYPVNTLFVQAPDWQNATFPDITVCNLCPLVHESEMSLRYTDYVIKLFKITYEGVKENVENPSEVTHDWFDYIFHTLLTPAAYFNNFPIPNNFSTNETNSPILGIRYYNWDTTPRYSHNRSVNIEPIWDPDYYKCFKFKLDKSERNMVRGFSGIFYLENFLEILWAPYSLDVTKSQATGFRVMIHPPGTVPNMKQGMNIGPGMDTTITLTQLTHTRLPAPYSNCITNQTLGTSEGNATYTEEYCVDVCLQRQYLKHCGCVSSNLQFTKSQLREANNTVCGNCGYTNINSSTNWDGFGQLLCAVLFHEDESACNAECFTPCEENRYTTSLSAAPWPHVSALLSFYDTYILNKPRFGNTFDEYQTLAENAFYNKTFSRDLLKKLYNEGLI